MRGDDGLVHQPAERLPGLASFFGVFHGLGSGSSTVLTSIGTILAMLALTAIFALAWLATVSLDVFATNWSRALHVALNVELDGVKILEKTKGNNGLVHEQFFVTLDESSTDWCRAGEVSADLDVVDVSLSELLKTTEHMW